MNLRQKIVNDDVDASHR